LLAVSDKPLHAQPKLSADAQSFYAASRRQHVEIAISVAEKVRQLYPGGLPAADLRSADEPLLGTTSPEPTQTPCCAPALPMLYQALPPGYLRRHRREPSACAHVPAYWLLSSVACTKWRPCSTSGCRRRPGRHPGPSGPAEARCRTWSTGLPPAAGAGCAAWPSVVPPVVSPAPDRG
jgi:hypothetical protein